MNDRISTNSDPHSKRVAFHYDRLSAVYDRRWAFYTEASIRETLNRLDPPEHSTVLDLGCGTGALMQPLIEKRPDLNVVGIDLSKQMLSLADRKIGKASLIQANGQILPFRRACFDLVVCCNSFHFLGRPFDALEEMMRVLRPAGEVVITDWCDDYFFCKLCDLYLRWFDPAHFQMYGSRECRSMLEETGFEFDSLERYRISWLWGLMTVRARRPRTVPKIQDGQDRDEKVRFLQSPDRGSLQ